MALKLRAPNDQYTMQGFFDGSPFGIPNVTFRYRYASPQANEEYRYRISIATSGADPLKAKTDLLVGRVVNWDIVDDKDQPAVPDENALKNPWMPDPLLGHLVNAVQGYTPPVQVADEKK